MELPKAALFWQTCCMRCAKPKTPAFIALACLLITSCASKRVCYEIQPATERSVLVLGSVAHQGAVPWTIKLTLIEAIMKAGGLLKHGNSHAIKLATPFNSWPMHLTREQVIDARKDRTDVTIPDRSVIVVPERMLNW
ncbi:MAG: hypothetical protein NTY98_17400 [Verrucomicrobia bacterium]|nr:hypothetical protein [Verrucomicrobiota bacterium]